MAGRGQDRLARKQCGGCGIIKITKAHSHILNGNTHCGHWQIRDKPRYVYSLGSKERIDVSDENTNSLISKSHRPENNPKRNNDE